MIRIEFALGDRKYEAVSYTEPGESVDGDTMISRTKGEHGGGIGEEEGESLWDHRAEWLKELKSGSCDLVFIKWRYPGNSRLVCCFGWGSRDLYQFWRHLDGEWDDKGLVLRRIA